MGSRQSKSLAAFALSGPAMLHFPAMSLTDADIARITEVVATKEDVASLNKRIDGLDAKVTTINERVGTLDDRVSALDEHVRGLDTRIAGVELGLVHVQRQVAETNERMTVFETKLDQHLVLLDKLVGKVDAMRLEYAAVSTQLSRHEEWIKKLAEKVGVALEA